MATNDWLDDVLYRTIPSLDLAMLCRQETQANREPHDFSAGFERRMRRLIRKERRKQNRLIGKRRMKNQESENVQVHGFSFPKRKLIPVLLLILLALTATVALAANFKKIVQRFHWYDESQGADCYDFKLNQQIETEDVSWIYPSYMPLGYELTKEDKSEEFGHLKLEYNNEKGDLIWYYMWMIKNMSMAFDAEYDSSETMEINGLSWFATWKRGGYRMARTQKGDVFYWVSGPPELSREELIKILEGIIPADRDAEEMNMEVENYEEARKIYFGE